MVSIQTSGHKCFACKDGRYQPYYHGSDYDEFCRLPVIDKNKCNQCGHIIKSNLYEGDIIHVRDVSMMLVEEALNIDMSALSGNIDDVIKAAKEFSILYDLAYVRLQFRRDEVVGLRFETPLERGERVLKESNKRKDDEDEKKQNDKKLRERYEFLKNKYAPKDATNEQKA